MRPRVEWLESRCLLSGAGAEASQGLASYGQTPLSFEPNQGQADAQVQFLSRGGGYALFLTPGEALLRLQAGAANGEPASAAPAAGVLGVQLVGASLASRPAGVDELPGKSNYLIGSDPADWHTSIPNYARVEYPQVYPGIDLAYYGNAGQLEYDFTVAPGADPGAIALDISGADSIALDAGGDLILSTTVGDVVEHAPVLSQEIDGASRAVSGAFVLQGDHRVGFQVGAYDASQPLVIDPVLVYSTFLGGSGIDEAHGIAVDSAGDAFVTGLTTSTDFPGTAGSAQPQSGTITNSDLPYDAFVTKLDPAGANVLYSTYFGGTGDDVGEGIAVDDAGDAYITGYTVDGDFPTVSNSPDGKPLQAEQLNGPAAFVAKLNATGTAFIFASTLGGNGLNYGNAIALGSDDSVYLTGSTETTDFPTTPGAYQQGPGKTNFESPSTFVTKINSSGTALVYSTYLHGNTGGVGSIDGGYGIAVDGDGDAYVSGETSESDFPTKSSAGLGAPIQGYVGAFVAKFNPAGSDLIYSAVLKGTTPYNEPPYGDLDTLTSARAIAVDPHGFAYITGSTNAADLPLVGAPQPALGDTPAPLNGILESDAYVAKFSQDGQSLVYVSLLGGNGEDVGRGIAVDSQGHAFVTGSTSSTNFPTKNAIQATFGGPAAALGNQYLGDAFAAEFSLDGHSLVYSTYLGGSGENRGQGAGDDSGLGIALDAVGNAYISGFTLSATFPVTPATDPVQASLDGFEDAFVAKISGRTLTVIGVPLVLSKGVPVSGPVATFTTLDTKAQPGEFTAKINWGDGTISNALPIVQPGGPGTPFQVSGNHAYMKVGTFPVVVTVHDTLTGRDADNATDVTRLLRNQSETTIAIDPSNPSRVFSASNSQALPAPVGGFRGGLFAAYSTDGGVTWTPTDAEDHLIGDNDGQIVDAFSDPQATFDNFGNLFLTYVSAAGATVEIIMSVDGGKTFTPLASFPAIGAMGVDQPSIATGPGPGSTASVPVGSVWISYSDQTSGMIEAIGSRVTGLGKVDPFDAVPAEVPGSVGGNFGSITLGPKGQVLVNWQTGAASDDDPAPELGPANILVSLDPDGLGKLGFGPATVAATTNVGARKPVAPQQTRTVDAEANLVYDRSGGVHDGRVYLVYTECLTPQNIDTFLVIRFSDDDGRTWSSPKRVDNSDGDSTLFLPSVAVDQSDGDIAVAWYDTRSDPNDTKTQFLVAISNDGGLTFSADVPVSVGMSDASLTPANSPGFALNGAGQGNQYGDYSGLAFVNGIVNPAWADNSPALAGNRDLPQFDMAAARVATARVSLAPLVVRGEAVDASQGQAFANKEVTLFLDKDPTLNAVNFTATIDWGDGMPPTAGQIAQTSAGLYQVTGSHTYLGTGGFPIVVTINDPADDLSATNANDASVHPGDENSETTAADPTTPSHRFLASNVDGSLGLLVATSTDGGAIWKSRVIADGTDSLPEALGSPRAVFDQFGNLFLAYVDEADDAIVVVYSDDGGLTFEALAAAHSSGASGVGPPMIATGPGPVAATASVWVSAKDLDLDQFRPFAFTTTGLHLANVQAAGVEVVPDTGDRNFGAIAVGPNGQVLALVQKPGAMAGIDSISTSLDPDGPGPAAFGPTRPAADTRVTSFTTIPAQSQRGITAGAALAYDLSNGPRRGRVYLVYTDAPSVGSTATSIDVRSSDDSGLHWSAPVRVNDVAVTTASRFLPSLAVDPTNGEVAVGWYDTRDDLLGLKAKYYVAISGDGGLTFSPNQAVSTGLSNAADPLLDASGMSAQYGTNTGLTFLAGVLTPAWADNSTELAGNPTPPQFEVASGSFGVARVADSPLTAKAVDVNPDEGEAFTEVVATFTDADPNGKAGDFSATIDWGDKTDPSPGTIAADDRGGFKVTATHAYPEEGKFTFKVTILDVGGATTSVTDEVDVDDNILKATGKALRPIEGQVFSGVVATFTDADPGGMVSDYADTIDWGDGSLPDRGIISASGSTGLTIGAESGTLFAVGNYDAVKFNPANIADDGIPYLYQATLDGKVKPLIKLGPGFDGGLAALPSSSGQDVYFYAISNDAAGVSTLDFIDLDPLDGRLLTPDFVLGLGFRGGLAYDQSDLKLYAIDTDSTGASTLDSIGVDHAVTPVLALGSARFTGLTWDAADGSFYAVSNDSGGVSTLVRLDPVGGKVTPEFLLGDGFTGGLAYDLHDPVANRFYAIAGGGAATLYEVPFGPGTPDLSSSPLFELAPSFNDGFLVSGTHTYAEEGDFPVTVAIRDLGGSPQILGASTAVVIDSPPVALPALPTVEVFQGIDPGSLELARFTIPGGIEVGKSEYVATIDWGDGSPPGSGVLAFSGDTITVSGDHPFAKSGTLHATVTLTDDTGGTASAPITILSTPEISPQVRVIDVAGPVNGPNGIIRFDTLTITNASAVDIPLPIDLDFRGLPAGVTPVGATVLPSGDVFLRVAPSIALALQRGQTTPGFLVPFTFPAGLGNFTYTVLAFDSPPDDPAAPPRGFEANQGQAPVGVLYLSRTADSSLSLTATEAILSLPTPPSGVVGSPSPAPTLLDLRLVDANASPQVVGLDQLSGAVNYMNGSSNPWQVGVPRFGRVEYEEVYPGIALDYLDRDGGLEYNFTLAPAADPGAIRLGFSGAYGMDLDSEGDLVLHTAAGDVTEQAPVIYQEVNGVRQAVTGGYVLEGSGQVGFHVGVYDRTRPLVIDPVLIYSTYLGGSGVDSGNAIAVDAAGNTYVTGTTASHDFPTFLPFQPADTGTGFSSNDVFVSKFDPSGHLVYSTFLGGSGGDAGLGIAVDAAGDAYVTGYTSSADFPTTGGVFEPVAPGGFVAFVAKLDPSGSKLLYSTYLGGSGQGDEGLGIAIDGSGDAYVTGTTRSANFPLKNAYQTTPGNVFVTELNPTGSALVYSTYFGGYEVGGIAVDPAGHAYITGTTDTAIPTLNAFQATFPGVDDGGHAVAFVTEFQVGGAGLVYSTYLGGTTGVFPADGAHDSGRAIAVDSSGNAYITGSTTSIDFPTFHALQSHPGDLLPAVNPNRIGDAFVTEIQAGGAALVYSTYLGGQDADEGNGIAVDAAGEAFVTGQTASLDFPIAHALQSATQGGTDVNGTSGKTDAFVAGIQAGGSGLLYSTYLGGNGDDSGDGIAADSAGDVFVTGQTASTDLRTLDAAQPAYTGLFGNPGDDAFVERINAQGAGVLQVFDLPVQATEGEAFTGAVARFTETDASTAGQYSATILWGDGTTSAGSILATGDGAFTVDGTHTYAEEGQDQIRVSVRAPDGTIHSAASSSAAIDAVGHVTYHVVVDTTAIAGSTGFLDFQFNAAAVPGSSSADVLLSNLSSVGGGTLPATLDLHNNSPFGETKQGFTFGTSLSFDVTVSGDALSKPDHGSFGSTFALQLRAADGLTAELTTDPGGSVVRIAIGPDGDTFATTYPLGVDQVAQAATAVVSTSAVVLDAPLAAIALPINPVENTPFTAVVATFTDANPGSSVGDFSATIDWGDGSPTSAGVVAARPGGGFQVTGSHTYGGPATFTVQVTIRDAGGSTTVATPAKLGMFQAPTANLSGGPSGAFTIADLNGDGKADFVALGGLPDAYGTATIGVEVMLSNGDGTFAPEVSYPVGSDSVNVVVGDFNGDGKLDIATNNSILLGNGDGTFGPAITFGDSTLLGYVAVGDFNGDGKLDLAIAHAAGIVDYSGGFSILLGKGDGTFGAPSRRYLNLGYESAIHVGDFNGDGKPDLLITHGGTLTSLLLGLGDGTFGAALAVAPGMDVTPGDFNGDGKLDIATSQGVFLGAGDGTFAAPLAYPASNGFVPAAAGDFNGDGKLDLVGADGMAVANFGFEPLALIAGAGDGTFGPIRDFPSVQASYAAISPADFNGDGRPDIALLGGRSVEVLFGTGAGFVTASTFAAGSGIASNGTQYGAIAAGDFNGDGKPDLTAIDPADDAVSVLKGAGDGTYLAAQPTLTAAPIAVNNNASVRIASGDFNGDGKLDVVLLGAGVAVLLGRGDDTFSPGVNYPVPGLYPPTAVVVGDFNGDGKPDLAVATPQGVSILLGLGDGTFGAAASFDADANFSHLAAGDLNGDGKLDLVATGPLVGAIVFLGLGDGTFQAPAIVAGAATAGPIALADLNGDGKLDLVAGLGGLNDGSQTYSVGSGLAILLGNGDGTFQAPSLSLPDMMPLSIAAADLNGDGKLDLAVEELGNLASPYTRYDSTTVVLLGLGDGTFGAPATYPPGPPTSTSSPIPYVLMAGDFRHDGKADLVEVVGDQLRILANRGDGTFLAPIGEYIGSAPFGLSIGDFNGDGKLDLASTFLDVASSGDYGSTGVDVLQGVGDGTFEAASAFLVGPSPAYASPHSPQGVAVGDFNGDGKADIVTTNAAQAGTNVALLAGKGDGTFQPPIQFPDLGGRSNLVVGDFNGDGKPDLAALDGYSSISQLQNSVYVAVGKGDGTFQEPIFSATDPALGNNFPGVSGTIAAGDFNGDGKLDLVTARGETVPTALLTAQLAFVGVLIGHGDGSFATEAEIPLPMRGVQDAAPLVAVGDFNGDGKPDIVVVFPAASYGATIAPQVMYLLLGHGDGTFQAPLATVLAGSGAVALVVGDFNGDGKLGVAIADQANLSGAGFGGVSVLLGNGDGTFGPEIIYALNGIPSSLAVTDLNGDGAPDLVVGTGNDVTVLLNSPATVPDLVRVADAPLSAIGTTIAAAPNVGFTGVVATFTDADPLARVGDYSATIDWGDGVTSPGQVAANARGGFDVTGTHTYAEAGAYAVVVAIADAGGSMASARTTGIVSAVVVPPLSALGTTILATERTEFTGVVATFTDAGPSGSIGDFTADVAWGDGTDSPGTIQAVPGGGFAAIGDHTYAVAGAYALIVTIVDQAGSTASAMTGATVTDLPITAQGIAVHASRGVPFSGVIASFTDADPSARVGDYSATIDWGDGTHSAGTIAADPAAQGFDVVGTRTYAVAGSFAVLVTIADLGGASATARSTADVIVPAILARGVTIVGVEGIALVAVPVAVFTQDDGGAASGFAATIDWGDGTAASAGSVSAAAAGYLVTGDHLYAHAGTFATTVTIVQSGGSAATAASTANVAVTPVLGGTPGASGPGNDGPIAGPPTVPPVGQMPITGPPTVSPVGQAPIVGPPTVSPVGQDGPLLLEVDRFGIHGQRTRLTLTFNGPLDPGRASDPSNYGIIALKSDGTPLRREASPMAMASATYDAATTTVTLRTRHRLNVHRLYELLIRGTGKLGVAGSSGLLMDGAANGHPGSDGSTQVGPGNLVLRGHHLKNPSRLLTHSIKIATSHPRGPRPARRTLPPPGSFIEK